MKKICRVVFSEYARPMDCWPWIYIELHFSWICNTKKGCLPYNPQLDSFVIGRDYKECKQIFADNLRKSV